jgi:hypothetical protein
MIRPIKACLALALVGGISGITGCVDLDEKLVSSLGSSYIATPQGLNDATTAVYGQLQDWYGRLDRLLGEPAGHGHVVRRRPGSERRRAELGLPG